MATFRSQAFTQLPDANGYLPLPMSDGAEISERPFIGTSGAIDVQGVATPIQRWEFPILATLSVLQALQAFTQPANVASGTLVDELGTNWTGMVLKQVTQARLGQDGSRVRAVLVFERAAP
jgi:hypothetical protein